MNNFENARLVYDIADYYEDAKKMYSYNSKAEIELPSGSKIPWMEPTRDAVFAFEKLSREHQQIELKVIHHFSKGVYARELHIPAGIILTGVIHKFENLNILSQGIIEVLTENGVKRVEAPFTIVSPAGTKRIARAITNCVWTTVHGTEETDLNIIEKTFIVKTEDEWLEFIGANQLQLGFN